MPHTMTAVGVGTSGTTIVINATTQREFLILTNDSDTDIYLALSKPGETVNAIVGQGIRLNANGGNVIFQRPKYKGIIFDGAVRGIHASTGTKNVSVMQLEEQ